MTDPFLEEVESFLRKYDVSATALGQLAANNPSLVFRLRNDGNYTKASADKLRAAMAKVAKENSVHAVSVGDEKSDTRPQTAENIGEA